MIVEVDIHMVLGTLGVLVFDDAHVRAASSQSSNWERDTVGAARSALVVLLVVLDKSGPWVGARSAPMIIEVNIHMVLGILWVLALDDTHVRAASRRASSWERDYKGAAQLVLVVLLLKDKNAKKYIDGGRDLTMLFEGGDLWEAKQDVVVPTAYVASGFGVEEAATTLLNKATNPATASLCTRDEHIVVTLDQAV